MSNSKKQELIGRLQNCKQPDYQKYLRLLKIVTNSNNIPSDEETIKAIGENANNTIKYLYMLEEKRKIDYEINRKVYNIKNEIDDKLIQEVDQYIKNNEYVSKINDMRIMILSDIIKENESKIELQENKNEINEINKEVKSLHNPKLKENMRVYHLWSDGEIDSTKGGEIYNMRSTFTMKPPITKNGSYFSFPVLNDGKDNSQTYAIIEENDAYMIREKMKKILNVN